MKSSITSALIIAVAFAVITTAAPQQQQNNPLGGLFSGFLGNLPAPIPNLFGNQNGGANNNNNGGGQQGQGQQGQGQQGQGQSYNQGGNSNQGGGSNQGGNGAADPFSNLLQVLNPQNAIKTILQPLQALQG